jgi:hypothetical protein
MKTETLHELLYQALETEQGGQQVYETAIGCARHPQLKEEWAKYLDETRTHEEILRDVFERLDLDPETMTPGRLVVRMKGEALVSAMGAARESGKPEEAEIVAAECVVEAETKDHQNWELIGHAGREARGETGAALREAHGQVEKQEDEHLYHTRGWARELWLGALGLPAVVPPPEEQKQVTTAIGAARAEQERDRMISRR